MKPDLVSEPIKPLAGGADTGAMARGEPGLPGAFQWRGREYRIVGRLASWKESSREGSRAGGELYLRRHCHRLKMSDGSEWTVYFVRQTPRSGSPKNRWFLYSINAADSPGMPPNES